MAENDSTQTDETLEGEGSEGTPDQTASNGTDEVALARRRQAGAEAARQAAEARAAEAQRRLDEVLGAQRSAEEAQIADAAGWKAKFEAEKARADEAEAKANLRILDAKFPLARTKFGEITDEVKLAELEVLLKVDEVEAAAKPPTPLKHNEKTTTTGASGAKKEPTADEVKATLLAMPSPF